MSAHLTLRSPDTGKAPKALRDVLDERALLAVRFDPKMRAADYLVTTAGLTAAIEREAARMGALAVVLPEGGAWLDGVVMRRLEAGTPVSIYYRGESK